MGCNCRVGGGFQASTLNPQPSTLNPQPSTLNPQPSTINFQPSTLHLQPSTLNPQPTIPSHKPSTLNPTPQHLNPHPSPSPLDQVIADVIGDDVGAYAALVQLAQGVEVYLTHSVFDVRF